MHAATNTMRGVVQVGFGDPRTVLRVADVDAPTAGADEVLVRVRAASIHIGAVYGVRGYPKVMRPVFKKFIADSGVIGQNIAGVVETVGSDVTTLSVGDEVFGSVTGAFATFATAKPDALITKPTDVSFEQAAAIGVSAFTALQALTTHGNLAAGHHVLVTGASGGVGSFAVQIAKALGAEVTAVCSTRNVELVRSIGADHVIDYTAEYFTTGDAVYDLILDNVGGHSPKEMRSVLRPDGLLLANGAPAPSGWFGGLGHPLRVALASMVSRQQGRPFVSAENPEDLRTLHDLAAAGTISPVLDRIATLDDAVETIAGVGEGHNRGTSIITMPA